MAANRPSLLLFELCAAAVLASASIFANLNKYVRSYLWTPPEAYWFLLGLVLAETVATGVSRQYSAKKIARRMWKYGVGYTLTAGVFFLMGKFNPTLDWVRVLFMDVALLVHGYLGVRALIRLGFLNAEVGKEVTDGMRARRGLPSADESDDSTTSPATPISASTDALD